MNHIIAQLLPAAGILTDIYTAPIRKILWINQIIAGNQSAISDTIRVSIAKAGALDNPSQYLYYDVAMCANSTTVFDLVLNLNPGDVIRVYSTNGTTAFNIFGVTFDNLRGS